MTSTNMEGVKKLPSAKKLPSNTDVFICEYDDDENVDDEKDFLEVTTSVPKKTVIIHSEVKIPDNETSIYLSPDRAIYLGVRIIGLARSLQDTDTVEG